MLITATHKSGGPLVFESTTASTDILDNVDKPGNLPFDQKKAYFERRRQLDIEAKIAIVKRHEDRLNAILNDISERAPGPMDDEVHKKIDLTALQVATVIQTYVGYANINSKEFQERGLINDLRARLMNLKGSVPDVLATQEHIAGLEKARRQVGDVLARAEAGIKAWVQGASIGYRGSLATGWRNANKSKNGVAQRINLLEFDSDAFVTIPDETWRQWNGLKIVLDIKLKDKMSLTNLLSSANAKKEGGSDDIKRVCLQLEGIRKVEEQLRDAMKSVKGYKMKEQAADFEFVLQPTIKTSNELSAGNLYPLDQISKAGLPLTEKDLDIVVENAIFKVKMPERHVSMSVTIGNPTYPTDPHPEPYTRTYPTERMSIEDYFRNPNRVALKTRAIIE